MTYLRGEKLNKGQHSLLTNALFVAGGAFFGIFVIALAVCLGFYNTFINSVDGNAGLLVGLLVVSIVLIIVSMFMSMYIWHRIEKVKIGTVITCITAYCISEGISFGILFLSIALYVTDSGDRAIY
jgi:FtsH-binding integral membrane protein